MKKQDSQQRVGIGVSSVLMILVVLAMTALSLLALGSARSNESMTSRNAIKDTISRRLSDYLYKKTKREPLIVPILMEL